MPFDERAVKIENAIILDARAPWIKEFGHALGGLLPATGLLPTIDTVGKWRRRLQPGGEYGNLSLVSCSLQRGWWRGRLFAEHRKFREFVGENGGLRPSTLVLFTSPYYADVASRLEPCSLAYYVTDNFRDVGKSRAHAARAASYEIRLAGAVDWVFPNSRRIAEFFLGNGVPNGRIRVVPNGFRAENLLAEPPSTPHAAPHDIADIPRPWGLVMGNLAANVDWPFLSDVVEGTPWLHWVLVGPSEMPCADARHARLREELLTRHPRVRATGWREPARLVAYARAANVAVLPYLLCEPTYSGSSTRFYEHLAAGRPILATRGFEELLRKEPLLKLCAEPGDMIEALVKLRAGGFSDGRERERWLQSRAETWTERAKAVLGAFIDQ